MGADVVEELRGLRAELQGVLALAADLREMRAQVITNADEIRTLRADVGKLKLDSAAASPYVAGAKALVALVLAAVLGALLSGVVGDKFSPTPAARADSVSP